MEAATDRARKRPVVTAANDLSDRPATGNHPAELRGQRLQNRDPKRKQPSEPRSKVLRRALSGSASRSRLTDRLWNSSSTRGMPASAACLIRLIPKKASNYSVAAATLTMSARASSRLFNASRRRSDPAPSSRLSVEGPSAPLPRPPNRRDRPSATRVDGRLVLNLELAAGREPFLADKLTGHISPSRRSSP